MNRAAIARPLIAAFTASVLAATAGCGATAYNVRAYRAYSFEEPHVDVAVDRAGDLAEATKLIERILLETPYTPGAEWVQKLPLTDEAAARIRERIKAKAPYRDGSYQVPLVKVYRVHLEEVMAQAPAPRVPDATDHAADAGSDADAGSSRSEATPGSDDDETATGEADAAAPDQEQVADRGDAGGPEPESDTHAAGDGPEDQQPSKAAAYSSLLAAISTLNPRAKPLADDWAEMPRLRAELEKLNAQRGELSPRVPAYGTGAMSESDKKLIAEIDALDEQIDQVEERMDAITDRLVQAVSELEAPSEGGEKRRIAIDGEIAVSVAYRLQLEALALLPIIAVQASRSTLLISSESREKPTSLAGLSKLGELSSYVSDMEERLSWQDKILAPLVTRLGAMHSHEIEQTPGFRLRESLVDQIAGISRDSFRINVNAGGEALFYHQSSLSKGDTSDATTSGGDQTKETTHDFTGRTHRLAYNLRPIYMLAGSLNVGFDWFHMPNAANLDLGYRTDRAYSSGGSIENSGSLGDQLGVSGTASDVIDLGLGVVGVQTAVKIATFTTGTVTEVAVDPATDQDLGDLGEAPLQLKYTQVDVGYDLVFLFAQSAGKYYIEKVVVGFRYLDYSLPRILYEMRDTNTSSEKDEFVFVRESQAQSVPSKYYMGGVTGRFGPGEHPLLGWYFDMALFAGGGPVSFTFPRDPSTGDYSEESFDKNAIVANIGLGFGLRYRVVQGDSRFRLNAEASYRGDLIYSTVSINNPEVKDKVEQGEKREINFGGMDIFHGPRLSLVGSF